MTKRVAKEKKARGADRRILIIEKAIDCIRTHGVQLINLSLVARELGLSQPLVFYYFPQQYSLFEAMLGHIVTTNRDLVGGLLQRRSAESHHRSLLTYVEGNLEWALKFPGQVGALLSFMIVGQSQADIQIKTREALLRGRETIYGFLVGGMAEKEFSLSLSPRHCAKLIHESLMGTIVMNYTEFNQETSAASFVQIRSLIESILSIRSSKKNRLAKKTLG